MSAPLLPLPALIADIGGTNARFALLGEDGVLGDAVTFPLAVGSDFTAAVAERVLPSFAAKPRSAMLALAGIVSGERTKITNGDWVIEPRALQAVAGLEEVVLINDFEALALALPAFPDEALVRLGGGPLLPDAPKLVIGPGTGLGIAALLPVQERWLPVATEGGHMDFGPVTPREFAIWPHVPPDDGGVKVETVLSGPGLENLYRAIATTDGIGADRVSAAEVVERAAHGERTAGEVLDIFAACLGRLAGDMAILLLARGGVYVGGGIPPRIVDRFANGRFRQAFVDKPPFGKVMEEIATVLITDTTPAFLGCAELIRNPDRYIVDLSRRHWR